jgi:DNA-binding MarR family transcriptional regulator
MPRPGAGSAGRAVPEGRDTGVVLDPLIMLTPGNLITHLRKLEEAGYLSGEKSSNGVSPRTSVATRRGREALDSYTALRDLLAGL